jgi:hypothetical protein
MITFSDGDGLVTFCSLCISSNDLASYWLNDFTQELKPDISTNRLFNCLHVNSVVAKLLFDTNAKGMLESCDGMNLAEQHLLQFMKVQDDCANYGWNMPSCTVENAKGHLAVYLSNEFPFSVVAISQQTNRLYCYSCLKHSCAHLVGIVHPHPKDAPSVTENSRSAPFTAKNLMSSNRYPCTISLY